MAVELIEQVTRVGSLTAHNRLAIDRQTGTAAAQTQRESDILVHYGLPR